MITGPKLKDEPFGLIFSLKLIMVGPPSHNSASVDIDGF